MKKKKPKLPKERKVRNIAKEVWQLCREICFLRDKNAQGEINCYTCNARNLQKSNKQLGHGYPKGALGVSMQYELKILKFQCYFCNINLGGCGAVFWKHLENEYGKKEADQLYAECKASKGLTTKARPYLLAKIEEYKKKLAELNN